MFVQVIKGRTSQPEALVEAFDRWKAELAPGATGWLGSTGGVTEDGTFIAVARFESEEAARANSARPEQDAWWSETAKLLDGDVTFRDSTDVEVDVNGDPDRAGFVQVMQGQVTDSARAKELMARISPEDSAAFRPEILGSLSIGHDDGRWTQVIYFTSEAEARDGERKEAPPEFQAVMDQMAEISVGPPDYLDLRRPMLESPG
jgi:hypothetical protein